MTWTLGLLKFSRYFVVLLAAVACTHGSKVDEAKNSACANVDWYEIGRADGAIGLPLTKLADHQSRCSQTSQPVNTEFYTNGRNAGLIEFCTATGGLEAGKRGMDYDSSMLGEICPPNLAGPFLSNFAIGNQIHALEIKNSDLQSRIDDLTALMSSMQSANSIRAQIDQLKSRQTEYNLEIAALEEKAELLNSGNRAGL
jgi:hypothetical protein